MRHYPKQQKTIFITGIASGIGRATAEQLLAAGHDVLGVDLNADAPDGARVFVADVTDPVAMGAIFEELSAEGVRLDAIVNLAGIHAMCSLVEGDYNKIKRLLEINLCGAMLVNRVLHPLLAEDGRIVIVTSEVAPLDPMPFNGLYNISKTALDCYAQALRQELNLLGQRVITVRPGAIETPLQGGALTATAALSLDNREIYGQAYAAREDGKDCPARGHLTPSAHYLFEAPKPGAHTSRHSAEEAAMHGDKASFEQKIGD